MKSFVVGLQIIAWDLRKVVWIHLRLEAEDPGRAALDAVATFEAVQRETGAKGELDTVLVYPKGDARPIVYEPRRGMSRPVVIDGWTPYEFVNL